MAEKCVSDVSIINRKEKIKCKGHLQLDQVKICCQSARSNDKLEVWLCDESGIGKETDELVKEGYNKEMHKHVEEVLDKKWTQDSSTMAWRCLRRGPLTVLVLGPLLLLLFFWARSPCGSESLGPQMAAHQLSVTGRDSQTYVYHRNMPLIFIGGIPRSGTTLMRAMLDAHPDVRCGQETRVIPRILQMRSHWIKSQKESLRLEEAGLSKQVLDSAIAAFCLEVIARHGDPAPRLCNKDPLTLKSATYLSELFPQAKFLLMARDGRATVHSIISRKVTITGFDLTDFRQCLGKWNAGIASMYSQCQQVGSSRCKIVHYESLVLHPRQQLESILKFLDLPWNDTVLHHEQLINQPGGVSLSKVERSSDQVMKPVNLEALSKWVGKIPEDVVRDMAYVAPMLSVLGYDPYSNPPNYGAPDAFVAQNTDDLKRNEGKWKERIEAVLGTQKAGVEKAANGGK